MKARGTVASFARPHTRACSRPPSPRQRDGSAPSELVSAKHFVSVVCGDEIPVVLPSLEPSRDGVKDWHPHAAHRVRVSSVAAPRALLWRNAQELKMDETRVREAEHDSPPSCQRRVGAGP
eukprot:2994153-Prymnesium_polylepis.3